MGKKKTASQLANKKNRYQKKQQVYLEKKRNEEWKAIPKTLTKRQLEEYKDSLENLVSSANKRLELIKASGYVSYAADRVEKEGGREFFDTESIQNRSDLLTTMTRLRVFMNDKGSTVEGAKLETAQINASQYKGKFGNQYNNDANKGARYDISTIDPEVAKRAFETYRKIEEHRATEIVGNKAYGSENLIIALYDAEIRGKDSLIFGEELLDAFVTTESKEWKRAQEKANSVTAITGIIEDNINGGYNF